MMEHSTDLGALHRLATEGGWAVLKERTILRFAGADRLRYLQGQCTQDLAGLQPGETRYACAVTAKGRLAGDFYVRTTDDHLWVDADGTLRETLAARLERYIIADDVEMEDVSEAFALIHLLPPFSTVSVAPPETVNVAAADRLGVAGQDWLLPKEALPQVCEQLKNAGGRLVEDGLWELARIAAGYARWGAELDEKTLPPEAGLEARAISYAKGCYTGQEVISRIRSIGHVNRTLMGIEGPVTLSAGVELMSESGDRMGRVTSWIPIDDERGIGLCYRERKGGDTLRATISPKTSEFWRLSELPFPFSLRKLGAS